MRQGYSTYLGKGPNVNEIETLVQERNRFLIGFLAAWNAWQLPQVIEAFEPASMPGWLTTVLAVVTVVGAVAFVFFMWRWWRLNKRICRDPEVSRVVNDERVRHNRLEAGSFGLISIIGILALLRALSMGMELLAGGVLQGLIVVAVTVPIGRFPYLELD